MNNSNSVRLLKPKTLVSCLCSPLSQVPGWKGCANCVPPFRAKLFSFARVKHLFELSLPPLLSQRFPRRTDVQLCFFSCLSEQSHEHWCCEGETAGKNNSASPALISVLFCQVSCVLPLFNNKSSAAVSHGVSTSHTSSFPALEGRRSPSDDLMRS